MTPPQRILQRRRYVSALSVPASVQCRRYFFRSARILNGFQWNKMIKFWAKLEQGQKAGKNRKFESTTTSVAAISNICWRLANEYTNFTVHTGRYDRGHNFTLILRYPPSRTYVLKAKFWKFPALLTISDALGEVLTLSDPRGLREGIGCLCLWWCNFATLFVNVL